MKDDMKFQRKLATSQHDHACKNYNYVNGSEKGGVHI